MEEIKEIKPKTDNVICVTGAAGGIGSATARAFANEGKSLILCDLLEEPLEGLRTALQSSKSTVEVVCGNISEADFPQQVITALNGRKLSVLAYTAGISPGMGSGKHVLRRYQAPSRGFGTTHGFWQCDDSDSFDGRNIRQQDGPRIRQTPQAKPQNGLAKTWAASDMVINLLLRLRQACRAVVCPGHGS